MHVKPNEIARKMVSKSRDIQAVAIFDSAHKLIAYATPPGTHDVEHFRTKAKKRIFIMLLMLLLVVFLNSKTPLLCLISLIYIGGNTFYGWDKFQAYCHSTFAFNIAITAITYSVAIYYAFYLSATDLGVKSMIVSQYVHVTPLIFLLLFVSVFVGYLLSRKKVGYIDALSPEARAHITLSAIAKNDNIEKYVLTDTGECNRLVIREKTNELPSKNKTFKVKMARNMGKLKK